MTKVHSREELAPALDLASEFAMKILVEKTMVARGDEVAVLGNSEPAASIREKLFRTASFTITRLNI